MRGHVFSSTVRDLLRVVRQTRDVSLLQEVAVAEAPTILCLVQASESDVLVCTGYRNQFDLITASGDCTRIHTVDKQKVSGYMKYAIFTGVSFAPKRMIGRVAMDKHFIEILNDFLTLAMMESMAACIFHNCARPRNRTGRDMEYLAQ